MLADTNSNGQPNCERTRAREDPVLWSKLGAERVEGFIGISVNSMGHFLKNFEIKVFL